MAVRLRPIRVEELDVLWAARQAEQARWSRPAGPGAKRRLRARIERSGRLVDGFLEFAVEVDGRLVGTVQARRPENAMPRGVFDLGIELFPEERGRGYGGEAVAQITELLFTAHAAHRVQASTWVENVPMRRVFERLGWRLEGVMRDFMPTPDGGLDDYALYALTRPSFERRQANRRGPL
jgi:[ribosomal protein S5]-alanine N-acetyltransferase